MYRQKNTRMCERAEEGENKLARTNDVGFGRKHGTTVQQRLQAVAIEDLEKDNFTDLGVSGKHRAHRSKQFMWYYYSSQIQTSP
jgi:hypothetical protein